MPTVSDFVVDRLSQWGVRRIFGYSGDGINGLLGAIRRAGNRVDLVQPRHEEMAAFMACGHAKFTGELGVCLATSGPGAIHLLNGLYDARLDHQPVLAIVGQQARTSLGADFQQEVDLRTLCKDVCREFVEVAVEPAQVRHLVDRAVRIALAERTPTCLILPKDVQEQPAEPSPPAEHGSTFSGVGWTRPVTVAQEPQLRHAADALNAGERVAMLVGAGALGATDAVTAVAERLQAGVAKALLGLAALPDDLPYVTGSIGMLGTSASSDLMAGCDTLLVVGSSFPYAEFLPAEGQARGVQIDLDGRMIGLRYPMEVELVGDATATLEALLPLLEAKPRGAWRAHVEERVAEWWRELERQALVDADPVNPQRVFHELAARVPDDAIVATDSGTATIWWARHGRYRRGMQSSVSGTLASMGCALPYALAAKLAHPDRPVLALAGDGAMQMNGLAELITVARYAPRFDDPRFVVLVLNNRDLSMVTWEQRMMAGDPRFDEAQALPDVRYAELARTLGLEGVRVDRPDDLAAGLDRVLGCGRPAVLEVVTDPNVPPLPPGFTDEKVRELQQVLAHDTSAGTAAEPERVEAFVPQ